MNADLHDRSVGDLTKQLSRDMSELVRREVELAKTEIAAKVRMLGTGTGLIAAAGILAVAMLGAIVAASAGPSRATGEGPPLREQRRPTS